MNLTHFHVNGKLAWYFDPLEVPGVSSRNFSLCRARVMPLGNFAMILDGFFLS